MNFPTFLIFLVRLPLLPFLGEGFPISFAYRFATILSLEIEIVDTNRRLLLHCMLNRELNLNLLRIASLGSGLLMGG